MLLNFHKIKINSAINRDLMVSAIQNLLIEIEDIFGSFDNFEMDLGVLGKFFVEEKNLRFMPYTRTKKKSRSKKMTIKNLIEIHMKKQEAINRRALLNRQQQHAEQGAQSSSGIRSRITRTNHSEMRESRDKMRADPNSLNNVIAVDPAEFGGGSERSFTRSIFTNNGTNQYYSPVRRTLKPPDEEVLMNDMFGAGTDPLALNQKFSILAQDAKGLIGSRFVKPDFARIRCPPVIDRYSRTLAAPVASQYNSLSASSRIALFYSVATKYLYFDHETKGIAYLKINENQTKLTANEELLQAIASEDEEVAYMLDQENHLDLLPKIEAKQICYDRYKQYVFEEIPRDIVAPIREYWITNILDLIPAKYDDLNQATMESIIDDILNEINEDYYVAIKKSILDYILKEDSEKRRIGILQRFDPPEEYGHSSYKGIIIDDEWVENISNARAKIRKNLVSYCQGSLSIMKIWAPISNDSYFELPPLYGDQLTLMKFFEVQNSKISSISSKIKDNFIPDVANIYQKDLDDMNKEEIIIFFEASAGLMSCQIRDLIYKSLHELRDFFRNFKKDEGVEYLDPEKCMENDLDPFAMLQKSFLRIEVITDLKGISLSNKRADLKSYINRLIDKVVQSSEKLPVPEKQISRSTKNCLWPVNDKETHEEDEVVTEIKIEISKIIDSNMDQIEKITSMFERYEYLIKDQQAISDQIEEEMTKEQYQAKIDEFRQLIADIDDKIPFQIHMSMALIDCRKIKKELIKYCDDYIKDILRLIFRNTQHKKQKISDQHVNMTNSLKDPIDTAEDLERAQLKIESIEKKEKSDIEKDLKEVVDWIQMLYQNRYEIESNSLKGYGATADKVHQIDDRVQEARDKVENDKQTIENNLRQDKKEFEEHIEKLEDEIYEIREKGFLESYGTVYKDVIDLNNKIVESKKRAQELNNIEAKVGFKKTNFEKLDKAAVDIVPFKELWELANQWKGTYYLKWYDNPIFDQNTDEVIKKTKQFLGTLSGIHHVLSNMADKPEDTIRQVNKLQKEIEDFKSLDKLLVSLSARGMEKRHWDRINLLCKKNDIDLIWSKTCDHSLAKARNHKMNEIADELVEISTQANREFANQHLLDEMEGEWSDVNLRLKEWSDTKTYVIQGETVDELETLLEDHIIKTQTMKGSSSAKVFESRINNWERDLLTIRDCLSVWIKVQTNWLYLQPIFLSPDIKKAMVQEYKNFDNIDKRWKDLMSLTLNNSSAMEIPKNENLFRNLSDMLEKLEDIQKKLTDYLNGKRSQFPRFYFLSADSLIEVLSEARDPTKIQKYAKILFEGVKYFTFDKDDRILGVESSQGEIIEFTESVQTADHKGLVEKWLKKFEETLITEVRRFIEISFSEFDKVSREEFVLNRPGMAVLNVDMTDWTRKTESALDPDTNESLENLVDLLDNNLKRIVELVKQPITKLARCTIEALIVLDVHNIQIVKDLIEAEVTSVTDFDYEAQLRYYWQQKPNSNNPQNETVVKIMSYTLDYNYEYLGNSGRLVITPLTDRCYRTLCGAIGLYYGGAPEGPAGTGKTETVKDLAKALARMIVVFNCSEKIDYMNMARLLKGLASTGGWSCFDEFNRIQVDVLSVIAQQLQSIQNAIKKGVNEFYFVDSMIKLIPTCNCFITMNPAGKDYAGRSKLPDNLKALFRSVAMMVPDYVLIAEIRLYSFGFLNALDLAKKIVTTYRLCSEQISAQRHYDYGMRAVNSVLKAAGNLRKKDSQSPEDIQVLTAINEVNEAKFLSKDLPLFKAITGDLFPETVLPEKDFTQLFECVDIVLKDRKLQPEPYFMTKIVELYQMILVRHGLMIVGDAYSSKSSAIFVLADALGIMMEKGYGEQRVQLARINPKSITTSELYGVTDIATGEWTNGVLPVKFKKLANDTSPDRKWMWFDGPVDAVWIEDMNTVLDDNKKLCLTNGDIFYLSDTMNLIFEPKDLLQASPATVSRVGMVYLEPHMMGWYHLYKSWKLTLPEHFEEYVKDDMDVYFVNIHCGTRAAGANRYVVFR